MIDIKEAVARAIAYANNLMGPIHEPLVEEVESTGNDWVVTISFRSRRVDKPSGISSILVGPNVLEFKTFAIDKDSGEVKSMLNRKLGRAG